MTTTPMRRYPRGYALITVLMVLGLLSVALATMFIALKGSSDQTFAMVERRKAFYACDGMSRTIGVLSQSYLSRAVAPNTQDLANAVCTAGGGGCSHNGTNLTLTPPVMPSITTPNTTIEEFNIEQAGAPSVSPLPSGSFRGMNARQTPVRFTLVAARNGSSFRCKTTQELTLGTVSMFQFFLFSDSAITDWQPGPISAATGRVHANGKLCIGGMTGLYIQQITCADEVHSMADAQCPANENSGSNEVFIAEVPNPTFDQNPGAGPTIDPDLTQFTKLNPGDRNLGTWKADALSKWNGQLLDKAHNVPTLRLPILGSPLTQKGVDANMGAIANNAGLGSRFLVDPVRAGDTADIQQQKFAHRADLRIIDGVWYIRDLANPMAWPGIPIYSDHPGSVTLPVYGVNTAVGQLDIENVSSGANNVSPWDPNEPPHYYSYYEADTNQGIAGEGLWRDGTGNYDTRGVISYGVLFRDGSGPKPTWVPGFRYDDNGGTANAPDPGDEWCGGPNVTPGTNTGTPVAKATIVHSANCPSIGAQMLAGTRSGFRDPHAYDRYKSTANEPKSNMLPVNFDVAEFQRALDDCTVPGELGCIFDGTTRTFNGIVWISSTWRADCQAGNDDFSCGSSAGFGGSEQGYGTAAASTTPTLTSNGVYGPASDGWTKTGAKDNIADNTGSPVAFQSAPSAQRRTEADQIGLPMTLCSDPATTRPDRELVSDEDGDPNFDFVAPKCILAPTVHSEQEIYPNAVRIFNARNVNREINELRNGVNVNTTNSPNLGGATNKLPNGITIATNLPVYVLGDVNMSSDPEDIPAVKAFEPFLIAGDMVQLQSNAWKDDLTWNSDCNFNRNATETHFYMEVLAGQTQSTSTPKYSGGINNFMRFMEDWTNDDMVLRGSLVVSHNAVYQQHARKCCNDSSYDPPNRDWGFDQHLNDINEQPPGAPLYDVAATKSWVRN